MLLSNDFRLISMGIPHNHFTHVFMDESGQATEPETLIPLVNLLDPDAGQVVMAGDLKQLGPVLRSPIAIKVISFVCVHIPLLNRGIRCIWVSRTGRVTTCACIC